MKIYALMMALGMGALLGVEHHDRAAQPARRDVTHDQHAPEQHASSSHQASSSDTSHVHAASVGPVAEHDREPQAADSAGSLQWLTPLQTINAQEGDVPAITPQVMSEDTNSSQATAGAHISSHATPSFLKKAVGATGVAMMLAAARAAWSKKDAIVATFRGLFGKDSEPAGGSVTKFLTAALNGALHGAVFPGNNNHDHHPDGSNGPPSSGKTGSSQELSSDHAIGLWARHLTEREQKTCVADGSILSPYPTMMLPDAPIEIDGWRLIANSAQRNELNKIFANPMLRQTWTALREAVRKVVGHDYVRIYASDTYRGNIPRSTRLDASESGLVA